MQDFTKKPLSEISGRIFPDSNEDGLFLGNDENGLFLSDGSMTLRPDFRDMLARIRHGRLSSELLVKAAKIRNRASSPSGQHVVLDATAGLGEDSVLLAAAGHQVIMYEKDPVIAALLRDAMARAAGVPELAPVMTRMRLHEEDSIDAMHNLPCGAADIVYLDPMFPERQKKSLVGKKFQLLHHLESPCEREEELLMAALRIQPARIIIKRPSKGAYLAGVKPDYSLEGKAVRYDIILPASRSWQ